MALIGRVDFSLPKQITSLFTLLSPQLHFVCSNCDDSQAGH